MLPRSRLSQAVALVLAVAAVLAVTAAFRVGLRLSNPTIASLTYLLIILVTATASPLWVAVAASFLADVCLNYFFMPPLGTFVIADPQNWVALFAFLALSVVSSRLSSAARDRAQEATARRDELARLFDVSRDVLLITEGREAITHLARLIARRFDLECAAVCLETPGGTSSTRVRCR